MAVIAGMLVVGAAGLALLAVAGPVPLMVGVVLGFGLGWAWPGLMNFAVVRLHPQAPAAATSITQTGVYAGGCLGPQGRGTVARQAGNPTTYDYGRMRETWLIHLCTDWMGDDAWLWKLDCEFRRFNYVGDTQWLRGTVTRHYLAAGDRPAVDLDVVAENQRGEVTTPGHATILLPSREHGPVRLPEPPGGATDLPAALDAIAAGFADGTAWADR